MLIINDALLASVSELARESKRLRMNFNLHECLEAKAQRLLNALEPGTVLPIHRHRHTAETYILLKGRIKVMLYERCEGGEGRLAECVELDPLSGNYGVDIPAGQWHTLEVLESGSVIFEVKDGPYTPLAPEDLL